VGESSKIQWTNHTFNVAFGCAKVSEGCKNCYADAFARRIGHGKRLPAIWGEDAERRVFGEKHWREPLKWNRAAEAAGVRARVFCSSMADVFENHPTVNEERTKLWPLIEATPWLDWMLLTKRPENMVRFTPTAWRAGWPKNVWAGATAETQGRLRERLGHLRRVPACTRFLSCEPLLEDLDLETEGMDAIDLVIIGGESGPNARPFDMAWARSAIRQLRGIGGVAVFIKQAGSRPQLHGVNIKLSDGHGGVMNEWIEDIQVREMPAVPT
jgi:protein gp37